MNNVKETICEGVHLPLHFKWSTGYPGWYSRTFMLVVNYKFLDYSLEVFKELFRDSLPGLRGVFSVCVYLTQMKFY